LGGGIHHCLWREIEGFKVLAFFIFSLISLSLSLSLSLHVPSLPPLFGYFCDGYGEDMGGVVVGGERGNDWAHHTKEKRQRGFRLFFYGCCWL